MSASTAMATQFHCQALVVSQCDISYIFNFLDHIYRIKEERSVERVPMLLVLQITGVEVLANHMKVQLPH